jgi:voltage-gated potassium channel
MPLFRRRALGAFLVFGLLVLGGATGYRIIEGPAWDDALYMTVITLTAVGYDEVIPLSPVGRSFTGVLLLLGITWMGAWFALITSFLVELDLSHVLRRRRMAQRLQDLEDHIIVCGAGRTGREVIRELDHSDTPWVVIERSQPRVEALRESYPEGMVLEGDATQDRLLEEAGIARARGLVATLSQDTDNLFICLSARDLNASLTIVARASQEESMDKLFRAGASNVVSPEISGGIRMASMLLRPSVMSFLDVATRSSELSLRIEQMDAREGDRVAGRTLADAQIPQETGLIVIALRRDEDGSFTFNPGPETRVEAGDELIVLGEADQIRSLADYIRG